MRGAGLDRHRELEATNEIDMALAHAQATGDVAVVHGRSGTGKSWAVDLYGKRRAGVHTVAVSAICGTPADLLGRVSHGRAGRLDAAEDRARGTRGGRGGGSRMKYWRDQDAALHEQAFAQARALPEEAVSQLRSTVDRLVATGAPWSEAKSELQRIDEALPKGRRAVP